MAAARLRVGALTAAPGEAGVRPVLTPMLRPTAASRPVRIAAVPAAVSQPKKQAPNFMPPNCSFCCRTSSRWSVDEVAAPAAVAKPADSVDPGAPVDRGAPVEPVDGLDAVDAVDAGEDEGCDGCEVVPPGTAPVRVSVGRSFSSRGGFTGLLM